jgi:ubiquinone/menaquinone biosynthesis C-methylase UbiE
MGAYYDDNAPRHDGCMDYESNEIMEQLLAPIIEFVEPHIIHRDVLEVACGTGNWTQVIAKRANSVLATDVNESVLEIARQKEYDADRVEFHICDAYDLDALDGRFTAVFASDWWSHIPKSLIPKFIQGLHNKIKPGSPVVMIDMLPSKALELHTYYEDDDGNLCRRRTLPNGREYRVVKNFPTELELREVLRGIASNIVFHEDNQLKRWVLICSLR